MSLLRDEVEMALQEILLASQKTIDQFRVAANDVEMPPEISGLLNDCARRRRLLLGDLANAVRASGDLPVVVDPEGEAVEGLIHRAAARTARFPAAVFLQQRIDAEQNLERLVVKQRQLDLDASARKALDALLNNLRDTQEELRRIETSDSAG
jgi:hypothetical protein